MLGKTEYLAARKDDEQGNGGNSIDLVVADLNSLPTVALCEMSRGQGGPLPMDSRMTEMKPWEVPMVFLF